MSSPVAPNTPTKWWRFGAVIVVAGYLLTAATLKATTSSQASAVVFPRAVQLLATQIEIALGVWLITGRARTTAWIATVLFVSALAFISLSSALAGQNDCGCFGAVRVHPWWTTVMNAVALLLLVVGRPEATRRIYLRSIVIVGVLALVAFVSLAVANSKYGEMLLAKWHGEPLVVWPAALNAGDCPAGTTQRARLSVVNLSDRDIRLTGGSMSCSCTTTNDLPKSVPAHSTVELEIEVKYRGTSGRFTHRFELFADSMIQSKLHGTVSGTVIGVVPE